MSKNELKGVLETRNREVNLFRDGSRDIRLYLNELLKDVKIPSDVVFRDSTMVREDTGEFFHDIEVIV